jgi:hypothetical protein
MTFECRAQRRGRYVKWIAEGRREKGGGRREEEDVA